MQNKYDKDGNKLQEADPGFTTKTKFIVKMWDFDSLYTTHQEKIVKDFVEFNADGSGWILARVNSISLHIDKYSVMRQSPTTTKMKQLFCYNPT